MAVAHRNNVQARVAAARPARLRQGLGQAAPAKRQIGLANSAPAKKVPAAVQVPGVTPAPAPWETDPLSVGGMGTAKQNRANTLSEINAGWEGKQQYYGFGNYANPLSQAALLSRQHKQRRDGNVNSSGYGLYSGGLVNRLQGADRDYDVNYNDLERRYASDEAQKRQDEREANERYDEAIAGLKADAIDRAVAEEPEPAPLPGNKSHKKKHKKGKK